MAKAPTVEKKLRLIRDPSPLVAEELECMDCHYILKVTPEYIEEFGDSALCSRCYATYVREARLQHMAEGNDQGGSYQAPAKKRSKARQMRLFGEVWPVKPTKKGQ